MPSTAPESRAIAQSWVRAVLREETRIRLDLHGYAGRLHVEPEWDTKTRRIGAHLCYLLEDADVTCTVAGEEHRLIGTSFCWVSAGEEFRFRNTSGRGTEVIRFRLELSGAPDLAPPFSHVLVKDAPVLFALVREMLEEWSGKRWLGRERLRASAGMLAVELARRCHPEEPQDTHGLNPAQRRAIEDLVASNPAARIAPGTLARCAGLSLDYFTRRFGETYGVAPKRWLVQRRLEAARLLLAETALRIGEISDRLGYPDVYLFSRQFRNEFGLSPRQWRERNDIF